MSLPLQWREWATPLMQYGVRFIDIGHMGQSDATLPSHGDEDVRAIEREIPNFFASSSERNHCSLARPLSVGRAGAGVGAASFSSPGAAAPF